LQGNRLCCGGWQALRRASKGIKPWEGKTIIILLIIVIAVGVALGIGAVRRLDKSAKPKREFYFRYGNRAAEIEAERITIWVCFWVHLREVATPED
jgi:hypothetical protein